VTVVGTASIEVHADTSRVGREIQAGVGRAGATAEKSLGRQLGGVAARLGLAAAFKGAAAAAAAENIAVRALDQTLRRAAGASDATVKSSERYVTSLQNATGIADDSLRPALARLVSSTKDAAAAQRLLALAADVSVARSIPLEAVATALGRAYNGNVAGLSRLGVQTKDAAGKTKSFQAILQDLQKTFGGVAVASADPLQKIRVKLDDIKEDIGRATLPAVTTLGGAVASVGSAFTHLPAAAQSVTVIGGLALAAAGPISSLIGGIGRLRVALAGLSTTSALAFGIPTALALGAAINDAIQAKFFPKPTAQVNELVEAYKHLAASATNGAGKAKGFLDALTNSSDKNAQAAASAIVAMNGEAGALGGLAGATGRATTEADRLSLALDAVKKSIDDQLNPTLDLADAQSRQAGGAAALREALKGTGEASKAVRDAGRDVAKANDDAAKALREHGAGSDELRAAQDAQAQAQDRLSDAKARSAKDDPKSEENRRKQGDLVRDQIRNIEAVVEAQVRAGQLTQKGAKLELTRQLLELRSIVPTLGPLFDELAAHIAALPDFPTFDALLQSREGPAFLGISAARRRRNRPPGRQHGGPVLPGSVYTVGEAGPELAVFPRSGQVIPADASAQLLAALQGQGTTSSTSHTYNIKGAFPFDPAALARALLREQDWALR